MSFDLVRMGKDEAFWRLFTSKYEKQIRVQGWKGPIDPEGLEEGSNWDALDNVINVAIHEDGKEEECAESDGGGIPGSADYAQITSLCGKFFVTGSYLDGGPYDSYEEAASAAGLD
jgi:hypothetical protein